MAYILAEDLTRSKMALTKNSDALAVGSVLVIRSGAVKPNKLDLKTFALTGSVEPEKHSQHVSNLAPFCLETFKKIKITVVAVLSEQRKTYSVKFEYDNKVFTSWPVKECIAIKGDYLDLITVTINDGCSDPTFSNYNPEVSGGGLCYNSTRGCSDPAAINYNPLASKKGSDIYGNIDILDSAHSSNSPTNVAWSGTKYYSTNRYRTANEPDGLCLGWAKRSQKQKNENTARAALIAQGRSGDPIYGALGYLVMPDDYWDNYVQDWTNGTFSTLWNDDYSHTVFDLYREENPGYIGPNGISTHIGKGYGRVSGGFGSFSASNWNEPYRRYAFSLESEPASNGAIRYWIQCSEAVNEIITNLVESETTFTNSFGHERWNVDVPWGVSPSLDHQEATGGGIIVNVNGEQTGDGREDEYFGLPEIYHLYTTADHEYKPGGFSLEDPVYVKTFWFGGMFAGYTDQDCTGNPSGDYYVIPEFPGTDLSWDEVTVLSAASQKCSLIPGSGGGKAFRCSVDIMFGTVVYQLQKIHVTPAAEYDGEEWAIIQGEPNTGADACNHGDYCFEGQYFVSDVLTATTSWDLNNNGSYTNEGETNPCIENIAAGSHTVKFKVEGTRLNTVTNIVESFSLEDTYTFTVASEVSGCTDPVSYNYNGLATCDDGSCAYLEYVCLDNNTTNNADIGYPCTLNYAAENYAGAASNHVHQQSLCGFAICTDPLATNFVHYSDQSSSYQQQLAGTWINPITNQPYEDAPLFPELCGNWISDNSTCTYQSIPGCTDANAANYNSIATENDGSCYPVKNGCLDPHAFNFNDYDGDGLYNFINSDPSVNINTHVSTTCVYRGCTDNNASNGNPDTIYWGVYNGYNSDIGNYQSAPAPTNGFSPISGTGAQLPYANWVYEPSTILPSVGDLYGGGVVVNVDTVLDANGNPTNQKDVLIVSRNPLTIDGNMQFPIYDHNDFASLQFPNTVVTGPEAPVNSAAWSEIEAYVFSVNDDYTALPIGAYAGSFEGDNGVTEGWYLPTYKNWQKIQVSWDAGLLDDKLFDFGVPYWVAATLSIWTPPAGIRPGYWNNYGKQWAINDGMSLFSLNWSVTSTAKVHYVRTETITTTTQGWVFLDDGDALANGTIVDGGNGGLIGGIIDAPLDPTQESLCNYGLYVNEIDCLVENQSSSDNEFAYDIDPLVINTSGENTNLLIGSNNQLSNNANACCIGNISGTYTNTTANNQQLLPYKTVTLNVGGVTNITVNQITRERVNVQIIDFEHPILYLGRYVNDLATISYDLSEGPIAHTSGATGNFADIAPNSLENVINGPNGNDGLLAAGWTGQIYPKHEFYFRVRSTTESSDLGLVLKSEYKLSTNFEGQNLANHPMAVLFSSISEIASIQAYYMDGNGWDVSDYNEIDDWTEVVNGVNWNFPIGFHPNAKADGTILSNASVSPSCASGELLDNHAYIVYKVTMNPPNPDGKAWGVTGCSNVAINFLEVFQGNIEGCMDKFATDSLFPTIDTNLNGILNAVYHENYNGNATISSPSITISEIQNQTDFNRYVREGGCYHFACTDSNYIEYDDSATAIDPNNYNVTSVPAVGSYNEYYGGWILNTVNNNNVYTVTIGRMFAQGTASHTTGDLGNLTQFVINATPDEGNFQGMTDWEVPTSDEIEELLFAFSTADGAMTGNPAYIGVPVWTIDPEITMAGNTYKLPNIYAAAQPVTYTSSIAINAANPAVAMLMVRRQTIVTTPDSSTYCNTLKELGCIDNSATNYNQNATFDDGSCVYDINIEDPICTWEGGEYNLNEDNLDKSLLFFKEGIVNDNGFITSTALQSSNFNCLNVEFTPYYTTMIGNDYSYREKNNEYIEICQVLKPSNLKLKLDNPKALGSYHYYIENDGLVSSSESDIGPVGNIHPDSVADIANHYNETHSGVINVSSVNYYFRISSELSFVNDPVTGEPYTSLEVLKAVFPVGTIKSIQNASGGQFEPGSSSSGVTLKTGSFPQSQTGSGFPDGFVSTLGDDGSSAATDGTNTCNNNAKFPAYFIYKVVASEQYCGEIDFTGYLEESEPPVSGCTDPCAVNTTYDEDGNIATVQTYYPENSSISTCVYDFGAPTEGDDGYTITNITDPGEEGCEDLYHIEISPIQECIVATTGQIQVCIYYSGTQNGEYVLQQCMDPVDPCAEDLWIIDAGVYGIQSYDFFLSYVPFESPYVAGPKELIVNEVGFYKIQTITTSPNNTLPFDVNGDAQLSVTNYYSDAIPVGINDTTLEIEVVSEGCTDPNYIGFDPTHTCTNNSPQNCGEQIFYGCTIEGQFNYDSLATVNETDATNSDSPCFPFIGGCTDPTAANYIEPTGNNQVDVNTDDGSCYYCFPHGEFNTSNLFTQDISPVTVTDAGSIEAIQAAIVADQFSSVQVTEFVTDPEDAGNPANAKPIYSSLQFNVSYTYETLNDTANGFDGDGDGLPDIDSTSELTNSSFAALEVVYEANNYDPIEISIMVPIPGDRTMPYAFTKVINGNTVIYKATEVRNKVDSNYYNNSRCAVPIINEIVLDTEIILGCTDSNAYNHNELAVVDDGSCIDKVFGCTQSWADNYDSNVNTDDGSCFKEGCTDSTAINYDGFATIDDGSCIIIGCEDAAAENTNPNVTVSDTSFELFQGSEIACANVLPSTNGAWWTTYQDINLQNQSEVECTSNNGSYYKLKFTNLESALAIEQKVSYAIATPLNGITNNIINSLGLTEEQFYSAGQGLETNLTLSFDITSASFMPSLAGPINDISRSQDNISIGDELGGGYVFAVNPQGTKAYVVAKNDFEKNGVTDWVWAEDCTEGGTPPNSSCATLGIAVLDSSGNCICNPDGTGTSISLWAGEDNTTAMFEQCNYASGSCYGSLAGEIDSAGTLIDATYTRGWHIPSKMALTEIANILLGGAAGGLSAIFTPEELNISQDERYWSSSEKGLDQCITTLDHAYNRMLWDSTDNEVGNSSFNNKTTALKVRPVRIIDISTESETPAASGSLQLWVYSQNNYNVGTASTQTPANVYVSGTSITGDTPVWQTSVGFSNGPAQTVTIPYSAVIADANPNFEWTFVAAINGNSGFITIENIQVTTPGQCEILGCTNLNALNYNPDATVSDNSCLFGGCLDNGQSPIVTAWENGVENTSYQITSPVNAYTNELLIATNYNESDTITYHIPNSCEYLGCTDDTATNFSAEATVDDGTCFKVGCTIAGSDNYDPTATILQQSYVGEEFCYIETCTESWADNYLQASNGTMISGVNYINDGSCYRYGCTYSWADNFDGQATDQGTTTMSTEDNVVHCTLQACTDPFATVENAVSNNQADSVTVTGAALANVIDPGSLVFTPDCTYSGCTDSSAFNYCPGCATDAGNCIDVVNGCTGGGDNIFNAENYNSAANTDDGTCCFNISNLNTFDQIFDAEITCETNNFKAKLLFKPTIQNNVFGIVNITVKSVREDNSVVATETKNWSNGSGTGWWDLHSASAIPTPARFELSIVDAVRLEVEYTYNNQGTDTFASLIPNFYTGSPACAGLTATGEVITKALPVECDEILGCTEPNSINFAPNANNDDGSCIGIVNGCTDASAFNYNVLANTDDGSCEAIVIGCMDANAFNYNPLANTDPAAGSADACIAVNYGCTDANDQQYNSDANTTTDGSGASYCCGDAVSNIAEHIFVTLTDDPSLEVISRTFNGITAEGIIENTGQAPLTTGSGNAYKFGKKLNIKINSSLPSDLQSTIDNDISYIVARVFDANDTLIDTSTLYVLGSYAIDPAGEYLSIYSKNVDTNKDFTAGHIGRLDVFDQPDVESLGTLNKYQDRRTIFDTANPENNGYVQIEINYPVPASDSSNSCTIIKKMPIQQNAFRSMNFGCTHSAYAEYDPTANIDDGSCATLYNFGCGTIDAANNYVNDFTCDVTYYDQFGTMYGDFPYCAQTFIENIITAASNDLVTAQALIANTCASEALLDIEATGSITSATFDSCWNISGINNICVNQVPGCTDELAFNWDPNATLDDGSCIEVIKDCMDPLYLEYNSGANTHDGDMCVNLIVEGCTDDMYLEYDPNANVDDGSCVTDKRVGCMDSGFLEAYNYDSVNYAISEISPAYNYNDQSMCITPIVEGCTDSSLCNYNPLANVNSGCNTNSQIMCTDELYIDAWDYTGQDIYTLNSLLPVGTNCVGYEAGEGYPAGPTSELCQTPIVYGCTDSTANNYNSDANVDDGSCFEPVLGCTDITAFNYDVLATVDDDSCFPIIPGCTNPAAFNYNDYDNDGVSNSLTGNPNIDVNTDDGSCVTVIYGCTDPTADNYNADATEDNDSCTYSEEATCEGDIISFESECALSGSGDVSLSGVVDFSQSTGLVNTFIYTESGLANSFACVTPSDTTLTNLVSGSQVTVKAECSFTADHYNGDSIENGTAGELPDALQRLECGQSEINPNTKIIFFYDKTSLNGTVKSDMYYAANKWVKNIANSINFTGDVHHIELKGERWLLWPAWILDQTINLDGIATEENVNSCGGASSHISGGGGFANIAVESTWEDDTNSYIQNEGTQGTLKELPEEAGATDDVLVVIFADESANQPSQYWADGTGPAYGSSMMINKNGGYHRGASSGAIPTANQAYYNVILPACIDSSANTQGQSLWKKDYIKSIFNTIKPHRAGDGSIRTFIYPSGTVNTNDDQRVFPLHVWMAVNSGFNDTGLLPFNSSVPACNITQLDSAVQNYPGTKINPYVADNAGKLDTFGFGANVECKAFTDEDFANDLNQFIGTGTGTACDDSHCYVVEVVNQFGDPVSDYSLNVTPGGGSALGVFTTDVDGNAEFSLSGTSNTNTLNTCHTFDSLGACSKSILRLGVITEHFTPKADCTVGCMDEQANNYNEDATISDGSCVYCPEGDLLNDNLVVTTSPTSTPTAETGHATFTLTQSFTDDYFANSGDVSPMWFEFNTSLGIYSPALHEAENVNPNNIYVITETNQQYLSSTTPVNSDTETYVKVWNAIGSCGSNVNCADLGAGYYALRLVGLQSPFTCTLSHYFEVTIELHGCTQEWATNYDSLAQIDDGSCYLAGCTHPNASNYNAQATIDNGTCEFLSACTDDTACNWIGLDPTVICDDDGCYSADGILYVNDNTCTYAPIYRDCAGNCLPAYIPYLADGITVNTLAVNEGLCSPEVDLFCHDPNAINFTPIVGDEALTLPARGIFARTSTRVNPPSLRMAEDGVCVYDNECVPDDIAGILDSLNRTIVDHSKSVLTKMKTGMITTEEYETLWKLMLVDYLVAKIGLESLYNCENYWEYGSISYTGENYLDKFLIFAFKVGDEHFTTDLKRVRSESYSKNNKTKRK